METSWKAQTRRKASSHTVRCFVANAMVLDDWKESEYELMLKGRLNLAQRYYIDGVDKTLNMNERVHGEFIEGKARGTSVLIQISRIKSVRETTWSIGLELLLVEGDIHGENREIFWSRKIATVPD